MQEIEFIRKVVKESKSKGIVLGISGGIDSAVVGELCVRSIGPDRFFTMMLPTRHTPKEDLDDANSLIERWQCPSKIIYLDGIVDSLMKDIPIENKLAKGNLTARLRMVYQYYYANCMNYLVAGTTDRTESFLGFYTKYGDGGCDFEPIEHLTKTEVRNLGRRLELPENICSKKSSPRLWDDHYAEHELKVNYEDVDRILTMNKQTEHKRRMPCRI